MLFPRLFVLYQRIFRPRNFALRLPISTPSETKRSILVIVGFRHVGKSAILSAPIGSEGCYGIYEWLTEFANMAEFDSVR